MEKFVYFIRIAKSLLLLIAAGALTAALGGCSEGVGDPCMPEVENQVFSANDVYIEASSVQCETRVCGVFKFTGNPKQLLAQDPNSQSYIDEHVFCTCRCRAPSGSFSTCSCPDGFECSEDILKAAGEGLRGGYCVRTGIMDDQFTQ
jgi:hypothetical protein